MRLTTPAIADPSEAIAFYWSADTLRGRSISDKVLTGAVETPVIPAWLQADWSRELAGHAEFGAGDVESLSLARTRRRWTDYRACVALAADWMQSQGLSAAFSCADVALMVCRGASFHHDGVQYGDKAFCNLFLSDDQELDVYFPRTGHRIALTRGAIVLFDTAQPHGVVARGSSRFDVSDFSYGPEANQIFLSWELSLDDADLIRTLGIRIFGSPDPARGPSDACISMRGVPVTVCPQSGQWMDADLGI